MHNRLQVRTVIELTCATLFAVAAPVTIVSAEWIEALSGWSPDGGNGSLEWLIVAALGAAAAGVAARGVKDLRSLRNDSLVALRSHTKSTHMELNHGNEEA